MDITLLCEDCLDLMDNPIRWFILDKLDDSNIDIRCDTIYISEWSIDKPFNHPSLLEEADYILGSIEEALDIMDEEILDEPIEDEVLDDGDTDQGREGRSTGLPDMGTLNEGGDTDSKDTDRQQSDDAIKFINFIEV